jgi:hypothetical protein
VTLIEQGNGQGRSARIDQHWPQAVCRKRFLDLIGQRADDPQARHGRIDPGLHSIDAQAATGMARTQTVVIDRPGAPVSSSTMIIS